MSEYVDNEMQHSALLEEELNTVDWSALQDEIMQEPWMQFNRCNWSKDVYQGDALLPATGLSWNIYTAPLHPKMDQELSVDYEVSTPESYRRMQQSFPSTFSATPDSTVDEPQFLYDFEGCKSKPFRRRGDLKRHHLGHTSDRRWPCPAEDCSRTGSKGFNRLDKLKDHILAGHKGETHFRCPVGTERSRQMSHETFPRDLVAVHASGYLYLYHHVAEILRSTNNYRDCPILTCPFRINVSKEILDGFQQHPITERSSRVRADYTSLIGSRGYNAATGDVVCPICTRHFKFSGHSAFYRHLIDAHLNGLSLPEATKRNIKPNSTMLFGLSRDVEEVGIALKNSGPVSEEIRQHKRTILSLWPLFEVHPVFNEIRGGPYKFI